MQTIKNTLLRQHHLHHQTAPMVLLLHLTVLLLMARLAKDHIRNLVKAIRSMASMANMASTLTRSQGTSSLIITTIKLT
jgi:hypothetical protein